MKTVYFDLETGGVTNEPTIQLAAIVIEDSTWTEVASFEQKIQFDPAACDPKALEINHYDPEAWKSAISPARTAERFAQFIRPHCSIKMVSKRTGAPYYVAKLYGYNALTFDLPRLKALFEGAFFPCSYLVRDVLQRALFWFDENPDIERPENTKLTTVCEYFGIPVDGAHDALFDVRLTAQLARVFAKGLPE